MVKHLESLKMSVLLLQEFGAVKIEINPGIIECKINSTFTCDIFIIY